MGRRAKLAPGAMNDLPGPRPKSQGEATAPQGSAPSTEPSTARSLAALLEGNELYPLIADGPDPTVLLRGERCVAGNAAFLRFLRLAPEASVLGRELLELVPPAERAATRRRLSSSLEGGSARAPFRFDTQDGETVTAELVRAAKLSVHGQVLTLLVLRDVTETRRRFAKMFLADRMMSVGTLAAGVAHEINNPLSYVIGNLSFLAEELPALLGRAGADPSSDLLEAIEEAKQGAERVRHIVRDLQAFSRADHQSSPSIDVHRTIELAINMAWIEIRHRARLIKEFTEVPAVEASEARLGQVFLSLLLDAAHALPEGGADKHQIRVSTRADEGSVVIEISHSGVTPATDALDHAFDPFSANGVGLSIAHTIVSDLGGTITAGAAEPKGTRYVVRLVPAALLHAKRARAVAPVLPRGRVLVVDDEPLLASSIRRALREHDVTVVESGRRAIQALSSGETLPFDLVLCDLMMPELTGMDVYEWLKAAHPGGEERMVFMTGGTFTVRAEEFLRRVPNPRFEKPFELEKIRDFVRAHIGRARGGAG